MAVLRAEPVRWDPAQTGNVALRRAGVGSHESLQALLGAGLGSNRYILPTSCLRDK